MKTRVLVADDCAELVQKIKEHFASSQVYDIAFTASNGREALEILEHESVDLLLLDLVMPMTDGYAVLERMNKNVKVIVISALNQDVFIAKAMNLGADYYLLKPFLLTTLEEKMNECTKKTVRYKNKSTDERITNIFITVGIPAHIKGYQFLREAIKLAIENPDIINSITKKLYPSVARRFATSPSKVERAIRHAIEVAWNRGKIENINSLFGVRVYNHNEKPTNGEFIALVADKMLLESV